MDSGAVVEGDGTREIKVYTRKAFKGLKRKHGCTTTENNTNGAAVAVSTNDNNSKTVDNLKEQPAQSLVSEDANLAQLQVISRLDVGGSDDSSSLNRQQQVVASKTPSIQEVPMGDRVVEPELENSVKFNLASKSKQEKHDFRKKLEVELDMARGLMKRIEEKEANLTGFGDLHVSNAASVANDGLRNGGDKALTLVHLEVASGGIPYEVNRPLNQLRVSVLENSQLVSEVVEKEKRTPKANPLYRNSEFLLAKDKFPPAESNKKSKSNVKKQRVGELGNGFEMGNKFFKSCSALLEKLMKHKHGWVFNAPVDVKGLELHDYFSIIKHPMDLGTVKLRLNNHWYKSPKDFAEDVRLTFHNAMTYNPKGQDVHIMAEQLLMIFEDRWAIIELDYNREIKFGLNFEASLPTPTSRLAPPPHPPPLDMRRILDRSESMTHPIDPKPKPVNITTPLSRTPAQKKPKAKDPHKRDMTYEEKQKLSTNLQSLPSEKLDNIVQIIKKRNSALFQQDDEIEVDIDSVDAETLWELDRFVTNYRKILSKNKRKAELVVQARAHAGQNVYGTPAPVVGEAPKETGKDERHVSTSAPVQGEKQGDNASGSSSSSSDSSSSDSDSDSSSASRSDAEPSPRT